MTLFVDTSVWSLHFRRDAVQDVPQVLLLRQALHDGHALTTTGIVLQELLQGFAGPKVAESIIDRFRHIPLLTPDRYDYIEAAALRNICRRSGVQTGTIDALIAQLCIRHDLELLTTDHDFQFASRHVPLKLAMTR